MENKTYIEKYLWDSKENLCSFFSSTQKNLEKFLAENKNYTVIKQTRPDDDNTFDGKNWIRVKKTKDELFDELQVEYNNLDNSQLALDLRSATLSGKLSKYEKTMQLKYNISRKALTKKWLEINSMSD